MKTTLAAEGDTATLHHPPVLSLQACFVYTGLGRGGVAARVRICADHARARGHHRAAGRDVHVLDEDLRPGRGGVQLEEKRVPAEEVANRDPAHRLLLRHPQHHAVADLAAGHALMMTPRAVRAQ